jgi:hypothetical protein
VDPATLPAGSDARKAAEAEWNRYREIYTEWSDGLVATPFNPNSVRYANLNSFGVGSALVPSPGLLTAPSDKPLYVTIAENDHAALDGAPVSLHIIEIIPDRYRGAIKVIEG